MEMEEKWAGWNDGRNIIKGHGCLTMIDKAASTSYYMKSREALRSEFRLVSKIYRCHRISG
jgi:hypothetical protein